MDGLTKMFRFSCFAHSMKPKKTVQLPTEAMSKTLNKTNKDHVSSKNIHESINMSPFSCETCQDGKSEAHKSMNGTDNEHGPHDDELRGMRKCVSLGTGLAEYKDVTSVKDSSPSHGNHSGDEYPHISSNYANHASDLSHDYVQRSDEDVGDFSQSRISGAFSGGSSSHKQCTPRAFAKSNSLPYMHMAHTNVAQQSQSSEDLKALDSRWNDKPVDNDAVETFLEHKSENDNSACDEAYDNVALAKDWVIPVMDEQGKGKSVQELPAEDFKIRRIEKWVTDLQHSSSFEETNMLTDLDDHEQTILDPVEPSINDDKSILGIDAAKRYISSLNAAATTAQLANYGLVVIPFLSAFSSLRALNLSGNSIVKITFGALPRGLHILNLSKNNISTIEGLRELTRLRVLDLSYNHILRIGRGLASCSSLKELYLAGNKISEVDGLHRLLKLSVLDLRFNKVSTTKNLGQLAANSTSLQAISLEGNPAQKNIGDEHLKKFIIGLIPHIAYINRQSIKSIGLKDTADRIARADRATRVGRKSQGVGGRRGHVRLPPSGVKTTGDAHRFHEVSSQHVSCRPDLAMRRIHSEGLLRAV